MKLEIYVTLGYRDRRGSITYADEPRSNWFNEYPVKAFLFSTSIVTNL